NQRLSRGGQLARSRAVVSIDQTVDLVRLDAPVKRSDVRSRNHILDSSIACEVGTEDLPRQAGVGEGQRAWRSGGPVIGRGEARRQRQIQGRTHTKDVRPIQAIGTKEFVGFIEIPGIVNEVLISRLAVEARKR